jgi:hypothetical protein
VRGAWKIEKQRKTATLLVEPFEPLSAEHRDVLTDEGNRLVRFVAEPQGVTTFEVRYQ